MKLGLITTRRAAEAVGLSLITLQRWIATGKVEAPRLRIQDGRATRFWDKSALDHLQKVKQAIYCRGRGRKKRTPK